MSVISNSYNQLNYFPPKQSTYEKAISAVQNHTLANQFQDQYAQENRVSHVTMDKPEYKALKAITMRAILDHALQSHFVELTANRN